MNVLILGSGAREHALAAAVARSPSLSRLYVAPGNPGCARVATLIALDPTDSAAVIEVCRAHAIDFVIVGPEAPLVAGVVDDLQAAGVLAFGPDREAAQLEGSKGYTKDFCREFNIPTAAYRRFRDSHAALAYIEAQGAPIVVKADGLAAGKGVVVAATIAEAKAAVEALYETDARAECVVEALLEGPEVSFFALCDGERAVAFGDAQDHKRVGDGDTGPNTGGMGAYSPSPLMTPELSARVMQEIVAPTMAGMKARGAPFRGVLFAGLMLTPTGPQLLEYNVRFGDPEAEVVLPRFDGGYPGAPLKGDEIGGLGRAEVLPGLQVFHAGTARRGDRIVANGGRVLVLSALADDLATARAKAYEAVGLVDWPTGFCRSDIGARALV
jgi:phosphoribosylamine--glycine ligase